MRLSCFVCGIQRPSRAEPRAGEPAAAAAAHLRTLGIPTPRLYSPDFTPCVVGSTPYAQCAPPGAPVSCVKARPFGGAARFGVGTSAESPGEASIRNQEREGGIGFLLILPFLSNETGDARSKLQSVNEPSCLVEEAALIWPDSNSLLRMAGQANRVTSWGPKEQPAQERTGC